VKSKDGKLRLDMLLVERGLFANDTRQNPVGTGSSEQHGTQE
jgi:hypothetical protein